MTELDAPVPTRIERVDDAFIWQHFCHLTHHPFELAHRVPNRDWLIEHVRVPLSALHCCYSNPGDGATLNGLMGSVGWPPGKARNCKILDLADALREGLAKGTADIANPSLEQVLSLCGRGVHAILVDEQPIAFVKQNSTWCVREGTRRSVALCLLDVTSLEGMNLTTARQVAPNPR